MKSYDILGYANTKDGYCVCPECTAETEQAEWAPIFADSEWDSSPSCDRCHREIEVNLVEVK